AVPPRELDVSIHPGLSMIVSKCLAKDPEDRYQEASDLATALKSYKIVSVPELHGSTRPAQKPIRPAIAMPIAATRPVTAPRAAAAPKPSVASTSAVKEMPGPTNSSNPQGRKTLTLFLILALALAAGALGIRRYKDYLPTVASLAPLSTTSNTE